MKKTDNILELQNSEYLENKTYKNKAIFGKILRHKYTKLIHDLDVVISISSPLLKSTLRSKLTPKCEKIQFHNF